MTLLTAAVGVVFGEYFVGRELRNSSYDLLLVARPPIPANEAVLVYLDEESYNRLGQSMTAIWDRSLHAKFVQRVTAAGAKVIAFDVFFSNAGPDPANDLAFAEAMKTNGNAVIVANAVTAGYKQSVVNLPYEMLMNQAKGVGWAELDADQDLIVRKHRHDNDSVLPSLSWAAAEAAGAEITKVDTNRLSPRWINYYGRAGFLPSVSYHRIMLEPETIPADFFKGKVVFVGARLLTRMAGERKDEYRSPHVFWVKETAFMSGVEIQATMSLNLMRGDWLTRTSVSTERGLILLMGIVFGYGLVQFRPFIAVGVAALGAAAVVYVTYLVFQGQRIWFPWLVVVGVQMPLALICSIIFNSVQLYVQKRLFEQTLGLYLSPKLVKKFAKDDRLLKPGATKQTLTILFSDIASFTSISEGMDSDELAKSMNQYFQKSVSDCIFPTEGTVVKYIGDAIFAFWNAPDDQHDHALRACRTGLLFRDLGTMEMNGQTLITRIGLHTGVANVGNFGSTERVDYTALGENINLASRMEGLNKYLGTILLITGDTFKEVSDKLVSRFAGRFKLKGFEKAVDVHELIGTPQQAEASRPWREAFADALKTFQEKDFAAAEAGFKRVIELHADDGPSKFYLKHLAELKEHPLPEDWNGEVELKEK